MSELDGQPRVFYPRCRAMLSIVFDGYEADQLGSVERPEIIWVLPKSCTVHCNKYNQADSWQMVFSAVDLPHDPATVRAGDAEIYMYDAGSMDDSTMVLSRQLPNPIMGDGSFTQDHEPLIVGLFDEHSLEMSNDGKWVTLQGQDYTQLLLRHWPPAKGTHRARRIPVGQRLDHWAAAILAEVEPTGKMQVKVAGGYEMKVGLPVVGASEIVGHKRGIPIQQETTYFDVLMKVCTRHGYICYVSGLNLVIDRPKNITDITTHDVKHMAWGNNIENLSLTRKLGKEKVPRLIMKCWDDVRRCMLIVEVPDTGPHAKEIAIAKNPSKRTTDTQHIKAATAAKSAKKPKATKTVTLKEFDEYVIVPMYGIHSEEALRRAGEARRNLLGRGERKIVCKTRDLVDLNGVGIMNLKAGDAAMIHWQDFNSETFYQKSVEERIEVLKARGYQQDVAYVIAESFEKLANRKERPMRIREATYSFDNDGGLSIEMEMVDFVTVEASKGEQVQMAVGMASRLGIFAPRKVQ